jgi:hypothetical protein
MKPIRERIIAKPEVLARFTDEQLEAMEKRASISDKEEAALKQEAEAAFQRLESDTDEPRAVG